MNRRHFLSRSAKFGLAASIAGPTVADWLLEANDSKPFFKISLAQWSLHDALFKKILPPLEFPKMGKELGFDGLEYVSMFYAPQ
ncbi:MAG: sugar phosphate isomerase/epimerase, partial [Proteobacteria bacterium]